MSGAEIIGKLQTELLDCSQEVASLRGQLSMASRRIEKLKDAVYYAEQERDAAQNDLVDTESRLGAEINQLKHIIDDLECRLARAKRESRYL